MLNVIKLRKAGLHRNVESSLFVTKTEIVLDKVQKMCGPFANKYGKWALVIRGVPTEDCKEVYQ